ncbi:ubiquitin carboxyl-terminal hydrolase 37-like, partial [Rhincodon typus]|uniref:ubiquitin carboxyl-terminal hydrolase 37-like n=1 Tax=Rhincodon typus TaxID=259920 RepID=UPI00202F225C
MLLMTLSPLLQAEEIEYSCEKCNGKSAIVTHKFSRLPRVLILHLKRYSFNVQLSVNNKLGQQVIIPKYLTLAAHCTETTRQPFSLGWNTQSAISRPLKTSQSVNSTTSTSTLGRKYCFKSAIVILDSDSEEEQLKRAMVISRQLNEQVQRETQQEQEEMQLALKASKREWNRPAPATALDSSFDSMNEDELLAAVLEISKRETHFSLGREEEQEKPSSSPDTGFGDDEAQELLEQHESPEPDLHRAPVEMEPAKVMKDFDENKENKTPEGSQCEMDWMQQYDLDREREEQELQQALAQSLQEQEAREMKEDDDLKRATELSIQGKAPLSFSNCCIVTIFDCVCCCVGVLANFLS